MRLMYFLLGLALLAPTPAKGFGGIRSAWGEAVGYYQGLADDVRSERQQDWEAWNAQNQAAINDIKQQIRQIATGARSPGCIGASPFTCVATLAQTMAIADDFTTSRLFRVPERDVNGKSIPIKTIALSGFIPNQRAEALHGPTLALKLYQTIQLTLAVDSNSTVKSVTANLIHDPFYATTEAEYAATGAYEVIAALALPTCKLSPIQVYQFIENKVKHRSHFGADQYSFSSGILRTSDRSTAPISFCGRKFEFNSILGNDTDLVTAENPHGDFGAMMLIVK